ncbi:hypothetical protein TrST_g8500 [Triparma strigata]|uniref:Metallo-beta-lactamase domain-containing protein n=1 Tax=Triparma strigata TaxID=1606541 RepID=A0A9W7AW47_9STRA|nr:hypothetical protein TrST_g8500 [Triparma strigata]
MFKHVSSLLPPSSRSSLSSFIFRKSLSTSSAASPSIPLIYSTPALHLYSLPVTPLQMNQYLLCCLSTSSSALIDCGDPSPSRWVETAKNGNFNITKILQTHGHVDHVSGLKETASLLSVPVHAHSDDWLIFKSAPAQGMLFGLDCPTPPKIDVHLEDGEVFYVGELKAKALLTPGHSPGHLCFHLEDENVLISGDLVFKGSIGRTDFPVGCSQDDMRESLKRFCALPDETMVFPGHMGHTSVGEEKMRNPFLQGL